MNKNCYGVVKVNENENVNYNEMYPKGFIVREKLIDSKPVSFEYGTYLDNDIFMGVPIHFNLKDKLIFTANKDSYNYYLVPALTQFAVTTYTNKKTGKLNPILVEPTENNPAVLISAIAYRDNVNTITGLNIEDNSLVLRKYIDKTRKVIGLIMVNPDTGLINPSTKVTLKYGILGGKNMFINKYTFDPMVEAGFSKETLNETIDHPLDTEFIKLNSYIKPKINTDQKNKVRVKKNYDHDSKKSE